MKKIYAYLPVFIILLLSVLFSGSDSIPSQGDYYYWYKGEKYSLSLNKEKRFILFREAPDINELSRQLGINDDRDIEIHRFAPSATLMSYSNNVQQDVREESYWTIVSNGSDKLNLSLPNIAYEAPFFMAENGKEVCLSHIFYVKLFKPEDLTILEKFAKNNQVKILGNNTFMPLWYTLTCDKDSRGNALEMANLFYESGSFSASQPDLMEDRLTTCVNDPLFGDQWYLSNTGQAGGIAGIDIRACDAWGITQGDSSIIVAILDHGLEMNHPDMPNISPISFNTETGTSPSLVLGPHGVPVGGIVAAMAHNNQGIAGVAPNVTLMSISNSLILTPDSPQRLADGINFAWINGADIINNSWGDDGLQHSMLDNAIDDAFTTGRGGRGTVIVFASGNNNSSTSNYPANSNPLILNVGAIARCGIRSGGTSAITEATPCDPWGGIHSGSAYGSTLDVVAGGSTISSTDRQGALGYNPNLTPAGDYANLDYTRFFGGTSAAAPQVAGVAALVLSVNPNLTTQQVNNIIERTAQKVRPDVYNYTTSLWRPNGTWDQRTGYGLVDAHSAVLQACFPPIIGPDVICPSESELYTLTSLPPGASVTWSAVPSNALAISGSGTTVTVTPTVNFSNQATLRASISGTACGSMVVEKVISEEIINITAITAFNEYGQTGKLCRYSHNNYFEIFTNPYLTGVTYEVQIRHWPTLLTVYTTTTAYPITPLPANFAGEGEFQIRTRVINHPCADGNWTSSIFQYLDDCISSSWKVSPNPISETLSISIENEEGKDQTPQRVGLPPFSVSLYDPNGRSVATGRSEGGKLILDTSSLPEGSYLLHIRAKDETVIVKRIVLIER